MTTNNEQNNQRILEAVKNLHEQLEFDHVKTDLLAMYECALTSDAFIMQQDEAFSRWQSFKQLYNFLTIMDMHHDTACTGVNIIN